MSTLHTAVTSSPSGPVLILSGEADTTTVSELDQFLTAQLTGGTTGLTIDIAGLRFADSVTIRALVQAARVLKDRGGTMTLLRPQPAVAKILTLTGVDRLLTVRGHEHPPPPPVGSTAAGPGHPGQPGFPSRPPEPG